MTQNRLTVGKVEVVAVSDGSIAFATDDFFPDVPREAWTPYRNLLGDGHELLLNIGSFVLLSEGKTVLVDAGLGDSPPGSWEGTSGGLIADLERNGIGVGDVDMVVLTHLHADHVGWSITHSGGEAKPTFPNARYCVLRADWVLFDRRDRMSPLDYIREQVRPLADMGLMELMDGETALDGGGQLASYSRTHSRPYIRGHLVRQAERHRPGRRHPPSRAGHGTRLAAPARPQPAPFGGDARRAGRAAGERRRGGTRRPLPQPRLRPRYAPARKTSLAAALATFRSD